MSNWIKAITDQAIERVGKRKFVAKLLGVSPTELSWWANENHERFIPIDHLVTLDAAAGDMFLKEWANRRGYDLAARDAEPARTTNIVKIIAQMAKDAGTVESATLEATTAPKFSVIREREILDDLRPLKNDIEQLEAAVS